MQCQELMTVMSQLHLQRSMQEVTKMGYSFCIIKANMDCLIRFVNMKDLEPPLSDGG